MTSNITSSRQALWVIEYYMAQTNEPPLAYQKKDIALVKEAVKFLSDKTDKEEWVFRTMTRFEDVGSISHQTLINFGHVKEVVSDIIKLITGLCRDVDIKQKLLEDGAPEEVIAALANFPGSPEVASSVCGALLKFIRCQDDRSELTRRGVDVIGVVVSVLERHGDDSSAALNAIKVFNGWIEVGQNTQYVLLYKGIDDLMANVAKEHSDDSNIAIHVCTALGFLAIDNEARDSLLKKDVVDILLDLLREHSQSEIVVACSSCALGTFASNLNNRRNLMEKGVGRAILKAMKDHFGSKVVCAHGCEVLEVLALGCKEIQTKLITCCAITRVMDAMNEHPDSVAVVSSGCAVFNALAEYKENAAKLSKANIDTFICNAMRRNIDDDKYVAENACSALASLAEHRKGKIVLTAGLVAINAVKKHSRVLDVVESAYRVLHALAVTDESKQFLEKNGVLGLSEKIPCQYPESKAKMSSIEFESLFSKRKTCDSSLLKKKTHESSLSKRVSKDEDKTKRKSKKIRFSKDGIIKGPDED